MSTVQVTRQVIGIPGHTTKLGGTQKRSKTTRDPRVPYGAQENSNLAGDLSKKPLEPIDKSKLNLTVLKQYNDLVADDEGLTCRSLPPVKLSVKISKTKFVDSPRHVDPPSSRVLKPLLTMKTHAAGHHVFTEGISKKSKIPNPAFALPQMRVPYSNLPDNVMIYKEKDKFAFGVKRDNELPEPSPYRLTPKPSDVPSLQLHVSFPSASPKAEDFGIGRQALTDRPRNRPAYQLKSNKIVLDPIVPPPRNDSVKSGSNSSHSIRFSREPLAPSNSVLGHESPQKTTFNLREVERGDRRLSIVSIGDTVTQNIYERQKRNTRKLYPMYDHKSKQDEVIKRAKFGGSYEFTPTKAEEPGSTYTYKISSRSLELARSDLTGNVSPIKNNIRNRPPPMVNSYRGLGSYRRYASKNNTEYDSELSYHEQKFRRLYRRAYYPPNSPGSNSSTDISFLPGNPPPSVTSHIVSEDVAPNFVEFRKEMLTLMEEKEKTASVFSMKISEKKTVSSNDEDKTFVNADKVLEYAPTETGRSDGYETVTDTDIQMESMNNRLADERRYVKDNILQEDVIAFADTATDKAENGSKETEEVFNNSPTKDVPEPVAEKAESNDKQKTSKLTGNGPKSLLAVPTFSLDKLSHHPMGGTVRERTSLSRYIQSMTVEDRKPPRSDGEQESIDTDNASGTKDGKVAVPVTKLRLFSECSTTSAEAPRVSLTDEHGDKYDLADYDYSAKPDTTIAEKRLVANANIQFISPLVHDNKAKRQ